MSGRTAHQRLGAQRQPCSSHPRTTPAANGIVQQGEVKVTAGFQEMGEIAFTCHGQQSHSYIYNIQIYIYSYLYYCHCCYSYFYLLLLQVTRAHNKYFNHISQIHFTKLCVRSYFFPTQNPKRYDEIGAAEREIVNVLWGLSFPGYEPTL